MKSYTELHPHYTITQVTLMFPYSYYTFSGLTDLFLFTTHAQLQAGTVIT